MDDWGRAPQPDQVPDGRAVGIRPRLLYHVQVLAVVLMIVGSRAWVINNYSSPVPLWDQWDAEANALYIPWAEHRFDPSVLISPHNEHRCLWPRLLYLGLIQVGGQWDTQLEMVINSMIAATTAWMLMLWLPAIMGHYRRRVIMLTVGVLWTVPFCWENLLSGFHTQCYLIPCTAVLTIWGLASRTKFTAGWWVGACCAFAAVFTMGSGFLAAAAVLVATSWNLVVDRKTWRAHLPSLVVATGAVALGVCVSYSPTVRSLVVHTPGAFFTALLYLLSWPCIKHPWLAVIMYLPTVIMAGDIVRRRAPIPRSQLVVCSLIAWLLLQATGLAYARGLCPTANRYVEVLMLGPLANLLALMVLADRWKSEQNVQPRMWFRVLILVWSVTFATGLLHVAKRLGKELDQRYAGTQANLTACQQLLASGPSTPLHEIQNIPYFEGDTILRCLRHPAIQAIAPAVLQSPPALHDAGSGPPVFVENGFFFTTGKYRGETAVGSYNQLGDANVGTFRSEIIQPRFRYLEIPYAGYPTAPGMSLKMVVEGTQEVIPIKIKQDPHENWAICRVRAPSKPFRLVADDQNPQRWFAFAAPRQVSWLSAMNEMLLRWSRAIVCGGAFLYLLASGILRRLMDQVLGVPVAAQASLAT